jgi:hypothetical protein
MYVRIFFLVGVDSAEGSPKKAKGATLFLRETNEGVVTDPRAEVSDTVNDLTFRYTAGSFFQVGRWVGMWMCGGGGRGPSFNVHVYM